MGIKHWRRKSTKQVAAVEAAEAAGPGTEGTGAGSGDTEGLDQAGPGENAFSPDDQPTGPISLSGTQPFPFSFAEPPPPPMAPPPPPPAMAGSGGGRPWWRSPGALVIGWVLLIVLVDAGLTIARHAPPARDSSTAPAGRRSTAPGPRGGAGPAAHHDGPAPGTMAVPGCSNSAAAVAQLPAIRSSFVGFPGQPFGVVGGAGYSFVSVGNAIEVMRNGSARTPSPAGMIPATHPYGEAITADGRYLLAASGSGAVVISITAAEQGSANPIRGRLTSPGGVHAVEVTVSRDGRFAFVTLQESGTMAVFNLGAALAGGFGPGNFVGTIRLGVQPVGMSLSPDGRLLYVTAMQRSAGADQGTLSVIDVRRAETAPSSAIMSTVPAGCQPVRVITTAGGQDVWVTARGSNALLAFSAAKLVSDPGHALIARVQVGQGPIGLAAVAGGRRIVVANSNLNMVKSATSSLAVIDTSAALAGKPALVGLIRAGVLPREFALEPDGKTLLVTNTSSRQLEAVDISHLP